MGSGYEWVSFLHVVGAGLWFGAGAFHISIILGAVRRAGPAAGPFMATVLRRGGFGRYYGPVSTVTILAGLYLYVDGGWASDPFETGAGSILTLGVALGLIAYALGLFVQMPLERRMTKLLKGAGDKPPSQEIQAQLMELGAIASKSGVLAVSVLALAFLAMAGRNLV